MERNTSRISLHWVCFACRKQFREAFQVPVVPDDRDALLDLQRVHRCPEYKQPMVDMGRYFRPPARRRRREWEQLRRLAEHGFRFTRVGSVAWVQFITQATTGRLDADWLIAACSCHWRTEGQCLLHKIRRYGSSPRRR